jgi:hypothetical protein
MKGWDWIRNPWFRLANLASVFVVIAEDIFGWQCPLNTLEWNLRTTSSGIVAAASSPVGQLLEFLLREAIPGWAIHAMYWCLGALMIVMLFVNPPRFRRQESRDYA